MSVDWGGTGTAVKNSASVDPAMRGEVSRSFRLRALSGETVAIESGVDLKLLAWSSFMMVVHRGAEYSFQAGPHGFGQGAMPIPGVGFTGEMSVAGGRLHFAKVPAKITDLTAEGREYVENLLVPGQSLTDLTVNGPDDWIGYWTDTRKQFDLVLSGTDWKNAEREALHQLAAFRLSVDRTGLAARPAARGMSVFGTYILAMLSPLGGVKILPRREAGGLLPDKGPSLPLRHGGLRRMTVGERGTDEYEEMFVYVNRSTIGIVRDPRFTQLDQPDRLEALQDLNLRWT